MSAPIEVRAIADEDPDVIAAVLADRCRPDPDAPFVAGRFIPHDGTRRLLAAGRTRGGSALLQLSARAGDFQASGTREAAAREAAP